MKRYQQRRPDDWHVHVRQGAMLPAVVPHTADVFGHSLVMGNTQPPISTIERVMMYHEEITGHARPGHVVVVAFKLLQDTTPEMICRLASLPIKVTAKLYPAGVTTHSEDGVSDIKAMWPVFAEMQRCGMVLNIHGEKPGSFVLDRERDFLEVVDEIATAFPNLKIVLEHITTREAVEWVRNARDGVAATITLHHLVATLDDLIGGLLNPHLFCKPVLKTPADRNALQEAATSGSPKFFFGSDSAPHPVGAKECASGCAGVFTAPVIMPMLLQLFDMLNARGALESFTARFGAEFYGLPLNRDTITLVEEDWTVPEQYAGVVPFMAGETLKWRVQ